MEAIMQHQSPLFGRFTGQWHLQPLPFTSLREFFPTWSAEERVVLYAIMGGIPAYLHWLDSDLSLVENIRQIILEPGNIFLAEPELLLHDELRDLSTYQAILRAISKGCHTLQAISFVGLAFEKLAQEWVVKQARAHNLPFAPESVGSHWSRRVQVDVAAVNHQSRDILLGECKWGEEPVSRQIVRELIEQKGPKLRQDLPDGEAWSLHYAVFARAGFTEAAATELAARQGLLVDLPALDAVLSA
jgi:AAA+ ATPase superfamily predicted ATPase